MPPIQLSRGERESLRKLCKRPRQLGEIPADHEAKLVNYDLVRKRVLLLYITQLGHLELLRQRFRRIKRARPPERKTLPPARPRLLLTSEVQNGS